MPLTPRLKLPYPVGTDPAVVPADLQALASSLDGAATITVGPFGSRPPAATPGRFHYHTDSGQVTLDTGTAWVQVSGPHGAQHGPFGPDPIPRGPRCVVTRYTRIDVAPNVTVDLPMLAEELDEGNMWSPTFPARIVLPQAQAMLVSVVAQWHGAGQLSWGSLGGHLPSSVVAGHYLPVVTGSPATSSFAWMFINQVPGSSISLQLRGDAVHGVALHTLSVTVAPVGA